MAETRQIDFKLTTDASGAIRGMKAAGDALTSLETRTRSLGTMIQTHWKSFAVAIGGALAGREILDFAKRSIDAGDALNKLSQITGTTVEELSGYTYAARLSDVAQESLGQGLKKLSKNMLDAAAGTGDAKEAFAAMGVEVLDSHGHLKTTGAMLEDVSEKFSRYEDSAAKTALAQKVFGKAGADLIPLLNQGREGLASMAAEASKLGLVMSKDTAQAAEDFNDNMTRLKGVMEGFANKTMAELLPILEKYSNELVNASTNSGSLDRASKNAADTLKSVAEKVRTLVDLYGSIPSELTEAGAYGVVGLVLFGGKAAAIITTLTLINDLASKTMDFGAQDFGKKWQGYQQSFGNIWDVITGKRDWNTGAWKSGYGPGAVGVDYEPHGFPKPDKDKKQAPLLDRSAIDEYKKAVDALKAFQAQIDAMDPSLSQWDKQQSSLTQSAEKLIEEYKKYPDIAAGVGSALGKGQQFIDLQKELSINEENVKLSEDMARIRTESIQNELDRSLMLLDVDQRRASSKLDYEQQFLSLRQRYGEVSSSEAAQRGFDIEIQRLRIQKENISAVVQERSERAIIDEDAKGVTELLLRQKENEEEINRLLGIRSLVLREHTATMDEGFSTGWKKYFDDLGSEFQRGESYAKSTASAMHRAFEDFFMDPMNYSWDNLWKDMQRVSAKAMSDITMNLIRQLLKVAAESNALGLGGILGGLFGSGGNASMNWRSAWTDTNFGGSFASGGSVSPNKWYIVGEKGPEPFIPRTSGTIMPNAALAGSAPVINIINNNGSEISTQTRQTNQGVEIDVMIDNAVASKLATFGSASNKSMRQNYTASQRLTRR